MLDRGVPPVAIGRWVAVNQTVLQVALQALAAAQHEESGHQEGKPSVAAR